MGERGFCKGNKSDAIFKERRCPAMTNRIVRPENADKTGIARGQIKKCSLQNLP